jgi:hypothetical protein
MGHSRMDLPPDELELHGVAVGSDVEELECEPARAVAGLVEDPCADLAPRPLGVEFLKGGRESVEMATGQRRDPAPDSEGTGTVGSRQLKGDAAAEGPLERGVASFASPQSEPPGCVVEVEIEAAGVGVEARHDPAQEPCARRVKY